MRAEGGGRRAEGKNRKSKIRNRKFPKTVRAKLTLTTTAVVAAVLALLGVLVDQGTRSLLLRTIDNDLRRRGEDFARDAVHREMRGPRMGPRMGGPGEFGGVPLMGQGSGLQLPQEVRDRRGPPGGPFGRGPSGLDDSRPHFVRFEGDGPQDEALDADTARAMRERPGPRPPRTILRNGEPFRVYSVEVGEAGRRLGVIQVGYPLGDVEGTLGELRRLLLTVVVPLGTLLAGVSSLFIVGRMLRPLRLITDDAKAIGGGTVEGRLPVVGDDEFAGLATTLNGMLARLEETFRLEQATTRRLAETVEQQRRFTADASHELKTPLSTIKAHAGLIQPGDEDDRESVQAIDEAANRMRGLIDDLLTLARADGGSLVAKAAPVDLADAVGAAVGAVSPMAVEVRGAPRPLVVNGNGEALTRLFINLLDNAKKYAGTDEPVEVRLGRRGDAAEVTVVDRGVGIAPEHLPRLFDRFYRPDVSRTSETGGTGLGLAICREIASAHGGSIEVASREGQGTTFTVVLPLVPIF